MAAYDALPIPVRLWIASLLFLAAAGQLALAILTRVRGGGWKRSGREALWFVLSLLLLSLLMAGAHTEEGKQLPLPFPWCLPAVWTVALAAHAAIGIRREWAESGRRLSEDSVRQALDGLATGILFAAPSGRVVLVNRVMTELAFALAGGYPARLELVERGLAEPPGSVERLGAGEEALYRFADGRIFRFRATALTAPGLQGFRQVTAEDVTEIWRENRALEEENEALRATNEKLQLLYLRLADRIREEETLQIKRRVHNDIAASLVAISQLLADGSQDQMDAQVKLLREAVGYLEMPGTAGGGGVPCFERSLRRTTGSCGTIS